MIYVFKSQLYEFVKFSRVQQSATRHRVSEKNHFRLIRIPIEKVRVWKRSRSKYIEATASFALCERQSF